MSRNTVVFTPAQLAVHPLLKFNIPRQQIGPPSEPLNLSTFAADARNALDRADAALVEITAQLEESPFGKEAQERCRLVSGVGSSGGRDLGLPNRGRWAIAR